MSRTNTTPAPTSTSFEARWFAPTNPALTPIGGQLEARRGWSPPPPSRGIAFACISLVLVGVATAGSVFFLSPPDSKHVPPPISTTTVSNAALPSAEAAEPTKSEPTKTEPRPAPVRVAAPPKRAQAPTPPAPTAPRDTSLPDLDGAAAAAGMTPATSSTLASDVDSPTAPPTIGTTTAPAESDPTLEMKR